MSRPLTWMYRKLGWLYPGAFIALELQTAFLIAIGGVALFSFYYDTSNEDFLLVLGITLGLTAVSIVAVLIRTFPRLGPLNRWIKGARGPTETARAWRTAVNLPMELIKKDFWFPVFAVAVPVTIAMAVVYDLSWFAVFPIARRAACSRSATPGSSTTWRSRSRCGRCCSTSTRRSIRRCGSTARRSRCG